MKLEAIDWEQIFGSEAPPIPWEAHPNWRDTELRERQEDLAELEWLLDIIESRLAFYRRNFPSRQFEMSLASAFGNEAERLRKEVLVYKGEPELCRMHAFLALKYEIRTVYKQVGSILTGSDWQTPAIEAGDGGRDAEVPVEAGFVQREQGTYMRSYGSDYVKSYEADMLETFYPMSAECRGQCVRFLTTSGMSALELALAGYKKFTGERLPSYVQAGFYGEGSELAGLLLPRSQQLEAEQIHALVEQGEPIGCLLVDPGVCWPVKPAIDLERLMVQLEGHRQEQPLYVIVDRTLTGMANPLFERYGDRLPPHVVLISVESGIKYHEYGLDLVNFGFMAAVGRPLRDPAAAKAWVDLLALLSAGADPIMVRQLPIPDITRLRQRLNRLNRNSLQVVSFLRFLQEREIVSRFETSVRRSSQYQLDGLPWLGSIFYIQLQAGLKEADYQAWIDRLAAEAPEELHLVSGGSFGFDTFRFNTVTDPTGELNALRMSVGRDPIGQLMDKLRLLYRAFQTIEGRL